MASLVDSRPSPSPIPLPQSPPIKTTTNALPQAAGSTPSPYLDIPGAFPHDTSRPSPRQNTSETSREQASELRARRTSLPSMEKEGVKPGEHHDGVGPLPGSISETSVAKLPDERMQPTREADQPTQKHAVGAGTTSLPSHERKGDQPYEHNNGVGPLPGTSSETSVAKLPDESAATTSEGRPGPAAASTESQKPFNDTVAPAENRAPPAYAAQRILSPETEDQNVLSQHPPPAQQVSEGVDRGPDVGESPADSKSNEKDAAKEKKSDLERKDERKGEEYQRTKTIPTSESESAGSPTQRKGRSGRSSSDSDASHHKKASVMNMVKGEMKVLLGKASRNKGKVEEGEKLKKQGSE
ncbi:hypothetical protein F5888DRAFT_791105 [Russula emetica]|nr:hypothetical protein F5888DRAFT_791105 [Russula emetica]